MQGTRNVLLHETISTDATEDLPPSAVMQTAAVAPDGMTAIDIRFPQISNSFGSLYFAEVEILNSSESRTFKVLQANGKLIKNINLSGNFSVTEVGFTFEGIHLSLYNPSISGPRPLINAFEYYQLITTELATYSADGEEFLVLKF